MKGDSGMTITGKGLRDGERILHLVTGFLLLALVFTPLGASGLGGVLRIALVPMLVVSGMLMWQHARVTRMLRANDGRMPIRIR
jgi:thiosulfate reductase cytochrome b subunit